MSAQTTPSQRSQPRAAAGWLASPPPSVAVEIGAGRVTAVVLGTVDGAPAVTARRPNVCPTAWSRRRSRRPTSPTRRRSPRRCSACCAPWASAAAGRPGRPRRRRQGVRGALREGASQSRGSGAAGALAGAQVGAVPVETVAGVVDAGRHRRDRPTTSSPWRGRTSSRTTNRRCGRRCAGRPGRPRDLQPGEPAAGRRPRGPPGDWLLVHVTPDASTMAIVRDGALLLFRHRPVEGDGSLADLGHQTAMYYEDRLNGRGLARVVVAARDAAPADLGDLQALGRALEQRVGRRSWRSIRAALVRNRSREPRGGERAAIAAPVGVLLREREGMHDAAHQPRHPAVLQRALVHGLIARRGGARPRVHRVQRQRVPAPVRPAGRPRRGRGPGRGAGAHADGARPPRRVGASMPRASSASAPRRRKPTASSTRARSRGRRCSTTSKRRCRRR